jgi:ribonuclease HI
MTVLAYTDGAARGNPGEGGIGVIMRREDGEVLYSFGGYLGTTTNNVAEYRALLHCLKKAPALPCSRLIVHSDSQLMVRQISGEYRVKDKKLAPLYIEAIRLLKAAPFDVKVIHIDRESNREADLLANAGIDGRVPCPD